MGEKLVVGPVDRGLKTNRTAFNIDNDSFPKLINAYQWRGRVKRKRGTSLLNRLRRFFDSTVPSYGSITSFNLAAGAGNILTSFSLQSNGNIVPGSVELTDSTAGNTYTDPGLAGILVGVPGGSGTINYATGAITISGGAAHTINAVSFFYYPDLPVMGLEELNLNPNVLAGSLAFDTVYSYNMLDVYPFTIYDVSFYKNFITGTYPGYFQKTNWTPTTWNGEDYQQFWTVNYQGALWATNGIEIPFDPTNVGMQFKPITGITIDAAGPPALATLTIVAHGLVRGDFVFINEVVGIIGINWQTAYVVSVDPQAANTVQIEFPNATLSGAYVSGGIAQYLTNRSNTTKDCIRWYDGDPTTGNPSTPAFQTGKGWVNFMPPLSQAAFSIADLPPRKYYLAGARMIIPFKDRLLFIGPVIQASTGNPIYLQDTVIYSLNGTPYYTASYTNSPSAIVDTPASVTNVYTPILVPRVDLSDANTSQTASPAVFFGDVTGFGGFIEAGYSTAIVTASANEDVIIFGFEGNRQARFVYTGNDIVPFNFFTINSELSSLSTFSAVNMDRGVITIGGRGLIMTTQVSADRIDLENPDKIFEIDLLSNGSERVCAQRDFISEWIYFTYPSNQNSYRFPTETFLYNYRDQSWAVFKESYTTYGQFRKRTGFTWATVGFFYPTWNSWTVPWNASNSTVLQPKVIAGNQQGFVLTREGTTDEGNSLYIRSFSGNQITSTDHSLNNEDYIQISGAIGTIGAEVNGKIFSVYDTTSTTFRINPNIGSGTYSGGGLIKRLYVPHIQTKQFPVAWGMSRKTRLGPQQYLLTTTANSQITLQIFLSQNAFTPYNDISNNGSLVYTSVLYTCPESDNLGLTPANTNLNMLTSDAQAQTWHRMNTSLIGDTVQIGFTMSDAQMRALNETANVATITGATQAYPCVLTCANNFFPNQLLLIEGVLGMTQLNGNVYIVISATSTNVTINVDSTAFTPYVSGGTATVTGPLNATAEIEVHGFILDAQPSMLLA